MNILCGESGVPLLWTSSAELALVIAAGIPALLAKAEGMLLLQRSKFVAIDGAAGGYDLAPTQLLHS